ncbi:MAG TPA: SPOR domain-containing protein, partial [Gammaproteobacteria bacterium]|nr:SPOR domain-containing protein [Gammaproteobacteria bacterium]
MRHLFLVLVLVNLAFAAWSAWFAPSERAGRPADEGLPALTLVSEVPVDLHSGGVAADGEPAAPIEVAQPQLDAAADAAPGAELGADARPRGGGEAAAPADSAAKVEGSCTSVGPFRELSQAAAAAATLRGAGYQPQQRVAEGEVWSGYWVYIPAIPTEQAANEALAKVREGVREARIPDAYVIRNSDSGNLVSLGVFSEISGVSRLRDEVRALGFEPQVVDRMSRATVY